MAIKRFLARNLTLASTLTLIITVILFVIALFEKGFTHDMLLEAGVFLISVKLVLSAQKNAIVAKSIESKLDRLLDKQNS
jgi:hypothetical protein